MIFANAPQALADCTNPTRSEGAIIYNEDFNVPQVCAGSTWVALGVLNPAAGGGSCINPSRTEGTIFYNVDFKVLQYCDGTDWIAVQAAPAGGGCTPDPACPNVGDVCSGDSSGGGNPKYAGCYCYYDTNGVDAGTCKPLYVAQGDQSASADWKIGTGANDIITGSMEDGKFNHADRCCSPSFYSAFELCDNLSDGGYTDWYLPARNEIELIWRNSALIGGLVETLYWSSSETNTNTSLAQRFTDGFYFNRTKTDLLGVRCVRRD